MCIPYATLDQNYGHISNNISYADRIMYINIPGSSQPLYRLALPEQYPTFLPQTIFLHWVLCKSFFPSRNRLRI